MLRDHFSERPIDFLYQNRRSVSAAPVLLMGVRPAFWPPFGRTQKNARARRCRTRAFDPGTLLTHSMAPLTSGCIAARLPGTDRNSPRCSPDPVGIKRALNLHVGASLRRR